MEAQAGSRHLEILLLHELSAGTFARLYLAEARAPGGIERIVAVKILREQWNESVEVINRTRDEARLLARLRHKNILRVEDLSEIEGQLAIIMEFVDGLDLKQLVEALAKRGQRVPPRAALQIAAEAASALEAAYFKVPYGLDAPLHVVHRDIKPSNVMVSVEGEVKVLDFGTARSSQAFRSVQTGALRFGSLKYMSPERREGDRGEHAADVYALGLMLVEILKGEWLPLLPMDVQEHDETVAEEIARLRDLGMPNREWDVALRQVLLQMMAGEASDRPNAEQVAKLLRAFAEQAAGDTLDSFARDAVAPIARQLRGTLTGGALAGTRFVVNATASDVPARGSAAPPRAPAAPVEPARSGAAGGAPTPSASARGPTPARTAGPERDLEPAPAPAHARASRTFDDEPPTSAGQAAAVGAQPTWSSGVGASPSPGVPSPARPAPGPAAAGPAPAVARPAPGPSPGERVPIRSRAEPARSVQDDPPPPARSNAALVAGGVFAVLVLTCGGVGTAGALYLYANSPSAPAAATPPEAPRGASDGGAEAPAAVGDEPFSVAMDGAPVQWIRVHTLPGEPVLGGGSPLAGTLAADTYTLSLKQVGRPAIRGTVQVPAGGLALTCRAEAEGGVSCIGGGATVPLRP